MISTKQKIDHSSLAINRFGTNDGKTSKKTFHVQPMSFINQFLLTETKSKYKQEDKV